MGHSIPFKQCGSDHMTLGRSHAIDRIVAHYTATPTSARNNAIYFLRNARQSLSAHYFVGIVLIAVGLIIAVPGDHLTTYESLGGSDGYSYIREYVGGDAYNYIMGASLVAGHISGTMTMKAIFIAVGVLVACIGLLAFTFIADQPKPAAHFAETSADTPMSSEQLE